MPTYDNILISLFFNNEHRLNSNYWKFIRRIKKQKYLNIQKYLLNRYNDLTIDSKTIFKESLYRILNNVNVRIKCPICGKYTSFNILKENCYNTHCSFSCEMKDKEVIKKHNDSCLKKYGSINNSKKTKQTKLERYSDENYNNSEKRNNTNLKKYGNICSLQNDNIKEKTYLTNLKKYGNEIAQKNINVRNKIKNSNINTCIRKYGVDNIMKITYIYDKVKETNIEKYGQDNFCKSDYYKENYKIFVNKANETKRKNGTFNKSKPEDESYKLLKAKYPDILRQYKSNVYPFNCDFYVPSLDLYIECNYHWTHGKKLYEGTKEDNNLIQEWENKKTEYYDNAIKTWTYYDVEKYKIAKENNLNYLLFYNIKELKKWLNQ